MVASGTLFYIIIIYIITIIMFVPRFVSFIPGATLL